MKCITQGSRRAGLRGMLGYIIGRLRSQPIARTHRRESQRPLIDLLHRLMNDS